MARPDLDAWLPDPQVRVEHRRRAEADPHALWDAAAGVRLDETRTLGRLVRWRIPGTPGDLRFSDVFARYPFVVLDAGEDWSLSGLCGRIWTLARDYPSIEGAGEFRAWHEPHSVRVLLGHWVEPGDDGSSVLVSEARVAPTDRGASVRLRALWLVIGHLHRVIAAEPLPLAVARAEGRR